MPARRLSLRPNAAKGLEVMRGSLARRAIVFVILLAQFLSVSIFVSAQQITDESRPRRTQEPANRSPNTAASQGVWRPPAAARPASLIESADVLTSNEEPTIRVALSTGARAATVSTSGRLMNVTGIGSALIPLDVARVRLEPRLLSPLPAINSEDIYRLLIAGAASRVEAEQNSRAIREIIGEESQITFDSETKTWGLLVGTLRSRNEAEELCAQLNVAGFEATVFQSNGSQTSNQAAGHPAVSSGPSSAGNESGKVRLAARTSVPSREVLAFASGTRRSFTSSAPVLLASDDEAKAPVRYNDRPYRGRIEVFANTRGLLTVVNVIGLEDYVRGVVANELSPGGYPSLDALKAQAIAARTYALRNRGQFMSQGFDLLPTVRSQVYRGLSSEHPLSTRAVDETRGIVATYNGEPINALYTSTCGGRTEEAENIFNEAVPYLHGHECNAEGTAALASFTLKTNREPVELSEEKHLPLARDAALLAIQNFASLPSRLSDSWLTSPASSTEVRHWLSSVARISRQVAPAVTDE